MTVVSESFQHNASHRPLMRSWFFISTLLIAFVAWVIALTGQIIVSLQIAHTPIPNISSSGSLPPGVTLPPGFTLPPGITLPPGFTLLSLPSFFPVTNTPGTLWFALIAQGLVFLQLISALYSNTIRAHTPLITTFAAIVIVLAAFGVDNNLFSPATSQKLTAAGWLMTAIIDCLWVLCLTAGEGTRTRRVFDFLIGGGGLFGIRQEISPIFETKFSSVLGRVPGSRMRRSQRMAHDASPKVVIPMFDKPRETISPDAPAPPPSEGTRTNRSQRGSTIPSRVASPVGGGTRTSSLMQAEDHGSVGTKPENMSIPVEPLRALALYPYTGVADDPSELTFKKGDVLEILDKTGKWWEARKDDGKEGMVPSNYMKII